MKAKRLLGASALTAGIGLAGVIGAGTATASVVLGASFDGVAKAAAPTIRPIVGVGAPADSAPGFGGMSGTRVRIDFPTDTYDPACAPNSTDPTCAPSSNAPPEHRLIAPPPDMYGPGGMFGPGTPAFPGTLPPPG
jgi:hypothetical protein